MTAVGGLLRENKWTSGALTILFLHPFPLSVYIKEGHSYFVCFHTPSFSIISKLMFKKHSTEVKICIWLYFESQIRVNSPYIKTTTKCYGNIKDLPHMTRRSWSRGLKESYKLNFPLQWLGQVEKLDSFIGNGGQEFRVIALEALGMETIPRNSTSYGLDRGIFGSFLYLVLKWKLVINKVLCILIQLLWHLTFVGAHRTFDTSYQFLLIASWTPEMVVQ